MRIPKGRTLASGAAALLMAVTSIGIAYATIPTNNVIDACYTRSGGSLRVIDATVTKCGKTETSLAWNVQGPAGPQGAVGPAGPAGPAGANGVSTGFAGSLAERLEIDTATQAGAVVISKTVSAGKYVVTTRMRVHSSGFTSAHCWIPGDRGVALLGGDADDLHMTLTSGITHAGGAIELRCTKGASLQSNVFVEEASFTGIQVDTLN